MSKMSPGKRIRSKRNRKKRVQKVLNSTEQDLIEEAYQRYIKMKKFIPVGIHKEIAKAWGMPNCVIYELIKLGIKKHGK